MYMPPISYENNRNFIIKNPSLSEKGDTAYTQTLKKALYKNEFSIPNKARIPSFSKPVCRRFYTHLHDFAFLEDAYSNPISTSPFHDTVSLGLVNQIAFLKSNIPTNQTVQNYFQIHHDSIYKWSLISETKWSETDPYRLATIVNTYVNSIGNRTNPYLKEVKIFDTNKGITSCTTIPLTIKPTSLKWNDSHTIWVGDAHGVATLYDIRTQKEAKSIRLDTQFRRITSLAICENRIATGFNTNQLLVYDINKLDKPLYQYQFQSAVLDLKFPKPNLLIAGSGSGDQSIKFFDPTDSITPYASLEGLGQVTSIEIIKNQLLVGGGYYSGHHALRFYLLRKEKLPPILIGSHKKADVHSDRVAQVTAVRNKSKAYFLTISPNKANIETTFPLRVQSKKNTVTRHVSWDIR